MRSSGRRSGRGGSPRLSYLSIALMLALAGATYVGYEAGGEAERSAHLSFVSLAEAAPSPEAGTPAGEPTLAELAVAIQRLEEEVYALRLAQAATELMRERSLATGAGREPAPVAPEPVAELDAEADGPIEAAADVEQPDPAHEIARAFTDAFEAQPVDGAWAQRQESAIAEAFAEGEHGATGLRSARCQSTLCRVELEHASVEASEEFLMLGPADPAFVGRELFARTTTLPDGRVDMDLFVAREGHALPQLRP